MVAVLRLVMPRRRRRRGVAYNLVPRHMVPCRGCVTLRRMPRRGGSLDHVFFRSGRSHRSGSFALGRRIASGSRHRRSARLSHSSACSRPHGLRARLRGGYESAADRERHHHLLYCLVHCRVPFILRASPFSRLHRVRTSRLKFLTKFWRWQKPLIFASFLQHSKVAAYPERLDFGII